MNYKSIIKKQSFIIIATVAVMSLLLMGTSYAIFQKINKSSNQVIQTGDLTVAYSHTSSTLTSTMEPMEDVLGLGTTGYEFTVTNNGSLPLSYDVTLAVTSGENNSIAAQYIKYSLDGSAPKYLTSCSTLTLESTGTSAYVLNDSTLTIAAKPSGSAATPVNHILKLWISDDAPDDGWSSVIYNDCITKRGAAACTDYSSSNAQNVHYWTTENVYAGELKTKYCTITKSTTVPPGPNTATCPGQVSGRSWATTPSVIGKKVHFDIIVEGVVNES